MKSLGIIFLVFFYLILPLQIIQARSGCCSHHEGVCGCGCCDGSPLSSTCRPYYPECSQAPVKVMPTTAPKTILQVYPTITQYPTKKPTIATKSTITPSKITEPTATILPTNIPVITPAIDLLLPQNEENLTLFQKILQFLFGRF